MKRICANRYLDVLLRGASCAGRWHGWFVGLMLALGIGTGRAQWLTQTNVIPPGWSAVYLNVDASSQSLDSYFSAVPGSPIDQIWLWKTLPGTAQYVSSPSSPLDGGVYWLTYTRTNQGTSLNTLAALVPNSAYLVHNTSGSPYVWTIKGQPVPPSYTWDNTGLNFIGFDTPAVNPPTFQSYFTNAPQMTTANGLQIYTYTGGEFGIYNPFILFNLYGTRVTRGQAFWITDTNINNPYFGPFTVNLPNPSGLNYGASGGQFTFHLFNVTSNTLTVYAHLVPSETPPSGQTNIVDVPPLLLEGALNSSNLTYAYTALATTASAGATNVVSWTLPPSGRPGSDVAVTMGVNRYAMTASAGSLYAGILRFTDSQGFSQIDVPVSAQTASTAGLWVGSASVSQVGSYLKSYTIPNTNGTPYNIVTNADGSLLYQMPVYTNIVTTNIAGISNFKSTPGIPNPSFEDAVNFVNWPGYAGNNGSYITGWSYTGSFGVNTPQTSYPFADNGALPDGTNVAFSQDGGTLSTVITNLVAGQWYQVSFSANSRSGNGPNSVATLSLNGATGIPFTFYPPVGGQNSYYTNSQIFIATSNSAPLMVSYTNNGDPDDSVLVDNFTIAPVNVTITSVTNLAGYGAYVSTVNTNLGSVPVPYPLRLIVFNDGTTSSLLQRVYFGFDQNSNLIVSTTQNSLDPAQLSTARRITATHLPWNAVNTPWTFSGGTLTPGSGLTTTVTDAYDDQASNPFLHTYHPDHNNLDYSFNPPHKLPVGSESFGISRQMTLVLNANGNDFTSLTTANSALSGTYTETLTMTGLGGAARTFTTAGNFSLVRISTISTLITQ